MTHDAAVLTIAQFSNSAFGSESINEVNKIDDKIANTQNDKIR